MEEAARQRAVDSLAGVSYWLVSHATSPAPAGLFFAANLGITALRLGLDALAQHFRL
jgi:hypothetical protein